MAESVLHYISSFGQRNNAARKKKESPLVRKLHVCPSFRRLPLFWSSSSPTARVEGMKVSDPSEKCDATWGDIDQRKSCSCSIAITLHPSNHVPNSTHAVAATITLDSQIHATTVSAVHLSRRPFVSGGLVRFRDNSSNARKNCDTCLHRGRKWDNCGRRSERTVSFVLVVR